MGVSPSKSVAEQLVSTADHLEVVESKKSTGPYVS